MYLLSTIDGEVIEQMFHVSHLKRGVLRLPNGKSVKNNYKLEMIHPQNKDIPRSAPDVPNSSQTSVKTVLHLHVDEFTPICQDTDTPDIWCQSHQFSRTLFGQQERFIAF